VKPVSTSTEGALREALTRLVSGKAFMSEGRLTVANLAREAGVSRATANRAPAILTELREAAETAKLSRPGQPRPPQVDVERQWRDRENVIAQHVQVRALLQRADEKRRSKVARLRLIGDVG
jgi:hypothetical protein